MTNVGKETNGPWLVVGDFNKIVDKSEKLRGNELNPNKEKHCIKFMDKTKMINLGYYGSCLHGLTKERVLPMLKRERTMNAMCNVQWRIKFP